MEQKSALLRCFCALMWKRLETCDQFNHSIKRDMGTLRVWKHLFRRIYFPNQNIRKVFIVQLSSAQVHWMEIAL